MTVLVVDGDGGTRGCWLVVLVAQFDDKQWWW